MVWYGECGHRPLQLVSPAAFRHDNRDALARCRNSGQACSACQTSGRGRGRSRAGGGVSSRSRNNRGEFRATPCTGPSSRLDADSTRRGGCRHASDKFCSPCPRADRSCDARAHGESAGNLCTCRLAPRHRCATSGRRSLSWICSFCFQYRRRRGNRSAPPCRRHAADSSATPPGSQYVAPCTERQHASCGADRQQSSGRSHSGAGGHAVCRLHRSCRLPGIVQPSGGAHGK